MLTTHALFFNIKMNMLTKHEFRRTLNHEPSSFHGTASHLTGIGQIASNLNIWLNRWLYIPLCIWVVLKLENYIISLHPNSWILIRKGQKSTIKCTLNCEESLFPGTRSHITGVAKMRIIWIFGRTDNYAFHYTSGQWIDWKLEKDRVVYF